jgi:hypothetical protein
LGINATGYFRKISLLDEKQYWSKVPAGAGITLYLNIIFQSFAFSGLAL